MSTCIHRMRVIKAVRDMKFNILKSGTGWALFFSLIIIRTGAVAAHPLADTSDNRDPVFTVSAWLKGQEVRQFEKGMVYVVEFSSPACPPCRKIIPHLTEIHHRFPGRVRVVSVYVDPVPYRERDKGKLRELKKKNRNLVQYVRKLMEHYGDRMDYTIAVDHPEKKTRTQWGVIGTPFVFVIDAACNRVWSVYYMYELDSVLQEVMHGTFDAAAAASRFGVFRERYAAVQTLIDESRSDEALQLVDSLLAAHPARLNLHRLKLLVLAKQSSAAAHAHVGWMLRDMPDGFLWDGIPGMLSTYVDQPDFPLMLQVADRIISLAETDEDAGFAWIARGRILRQWMREEQRPETVAAYRTSVEKGIALLKRAGKREAAKRYAKELRMFPETTEAGHPPAGR